jgi:hypothetical protein
MTYNEIHEFTKQYKDQFSYVSGIYWVKLIIHDPKIYCTHYIYFYPDKNSIACFRNIGMPISLEQLLEEISKEARKIILFNLDLFI